MIRKLQHSKWEVIDQLRKEILLLQGFKAAEGTSAGTIGLGPVEAVFPNGVFPKAAVHEFLVPDPEQAAASGGFIAGLLKCLMETGSACLWISSGRTLFPPALRAFGIAPDRLIFIDLQTDRDGLWAMEEALKCESIAAVIAELDDITFAQSRRLQLAVEKSRVTGFLLRRGSRLSNTACTARWQISPLPSMPEEGLPGVGHPRWKVELLKVRNGQPGSWVLEWVDEGFRFIIEQENKIRELNRNTG